jgi:uncharacterized membrane protein YtjA (UPF0391 family)
MPLGSTTAFIPAGRSDLNALAISNMPYFALAFLVIAVLVGILGFAGLAGAASGIAQVMCFVFAALCVLAGWGGGWRQEE